MEKQIIELELELINNILNEESIFYPTQEKDKQKLRKQYLENYLKKLQN